MGAYNGLLAHEYINTGTYDVPVWVRIARLEDVDMPDERSGGELKTKESDDVKFLPGPRTRSVAFKYKRKLATDAVYDALSAAYEAKTVVDYMALNGPAATTGSKGIRGPYHVAKFSENRPFEGPVEVDVELKVADTDVPTTPGTTWEVTPTTVA